MKGVRKVAYFPHSNQNQVIFQFKDESAVAEDELKEVVVEEPEAAVVAPEPEEVKVSISPTPPTNTPPTTTPHSKIIYSNYSKTAVKFKNYFSI